MNNNFEYYPNSNLNSFNNIFNNIIDNKNNNSLYSPYEGFIKGNMFSDIYDEYKNYKPIIEKPVNELETDLLNLNMMQFALHDIVLYLDVHPNDVKMLQKYKEYRNNFNKLFMEYQQKYDALTSNNINLNNVPYGWENSIWPWEGVI